MRLFATMLALMLGANLTWWVAPQAVTPDGSGADLRGVQSNTQTCTLKIEGMT